MPRVDVPIFNLHRRTDTVVIQRHRASVEAAGVVFTGEDGCATEQEFNGWGELYLVANHEELQRVHGPEQVRRTFCDDCTEEYRAEVTEEGRCWRATAPREVGRPGREVLELLLDPDIDKLTPRERGKRIDALAIQTGINRRSIYRRRQLARENVTAH